MPRTWSASAGLRAPERARSPSRARRVHGRGQVDARARARGASRTAVRLGRRGCRGTDRLRQLRSSSPSVARRHSASSRNALPSRFSPVACLRSSSSEVARSAPSRTRIALAEHAFTVLLETTPEEAWERVSRRRSPARARPRRVLGAVRGAHAALRGGRRRPRARSRRRGPGGCRHPRLGGSGRRSRRACSRRGSVELVVDAGVEPLHGERVRRALGARLSAFHVVPAGEQAKTIGEAERLWSSLRLDREGTVMALGGGSTTRSRGLRRGVVPPRGRLGGRADDARRTGGRRHRREDGRRPRARQEPRRRVSLACARRHRPGAPGDASAEELRNGLAEVVKTGLLAGEPLWELETAQQVRRCAAFKAAVCLSDPLDRGARAQLNLGHTFAHALETASGYTLPHGRAVALGLLAALRLSGLEDDAQNGAGAPRSRAGRGRSGRGVGGARARQEGGRRPTAAGAARETRHAEARRGARRA